MAYFVLEERPTVFTAKIVPKRQRGGMTALRRFPVAGFGRQGESVGFGVRRMVVTEDARLHRPDGSWDGFYLLSAFVQTSAFIGLDSEDFSYDC